MTSAGQHVRAAPPSKNAKNTAVYHNLYKRGAVWWGRIWINGREIRWSLRTGDKAVATRRVEERRRQELAAGGADCGRVMWAAAVRDWRLHWVGNVAPKTAQRYAVSINQVDPYLKPLFLDEITRKSLTAMAPPGEGRDQRDDQARLDCYLKRARARDRE